MAACIGQIRMQGLVKMNADGTWAEDRQNPLYYLVHVAKVALPLYPQFGTEPNGYYIPPRWVPRPYLRQMFGPGVDQAIERYTNPDRELLAVLQLFRRSNRIIFRYEIEEGPKVYEGPAARQAGHALQRHGHRLRQGRRRSSSAPRSRSRCTSAGPACKLHLSGAAELPELEPALPRPLRGARPRLPRADAETVERLGRRRGRGALADAARGSRARGRRRGLGAPRSAQLARATVASARSRRPTGDCSVTPRAARFPPTRPSTATRRCSSSRRSSATSPVSPRPSVSRCAPTRTSASTTSAASASSWRSSRSRRPTRWTPPTRRCSPPPAPALLFLRDHSGRLGPRPRRDARAGRARRLLTPASASSVRPRQSKTAAASGVAAGAVGLRLRSTPCPAEAGGERSP